MITVNTFTWAIFAAFYFIFASLNNYQSYYFWYGFGFYSVLSLISWKIIRDLYKKYLKHPNYGSIVNVDNIERVGYTTFYAVCFLLTISFFPILIKYHIV